MDQFFKRYILTKPTEKDINNLNKQVSINEIESTTNKAPRPNGFIGEFYQVFKEEIIRILYNFFQRVDAERIFPNSSYKASITLIKKIRQRYYKKTILQSNISNGHRCRNPQQNIIELNLIIYF